MQRIAVSALANRIRVGKQPARPAVVETGPTYRQCNRISEDLGRRDGGSKQGEAANDEQDIFSVSSGNQSGTKQELVGQGKSAGKVSLQCYAVVHCLPLGPRRQRESPEASSTHMTPESVSTRPLALPISHTDARFRKKVQEALKRSVGGPTAIIWEKGRRLRSSVRWKVQQSVSGSLRRS